MQLFSIIINFSIILRFPKLIIIYALFLSYYFHLSTIQSALVSRVKNNSLCLNESRTPPSTTFPQPPYPSSHSLSRSPNAISDLTGLSGVREPGLISTVQSGPAAAGQPIVDYTTRATSPSSSSPASDVALCACMSVCTEFIFQQR